MIGIIDYGAGNIRSVANALERLGISYVISGKKEDLEQANKFILPGVGEARSAMESLVRLNLIDWLQKMQRPLLGICLGMQLLFDRSSERGTLCLGLIKGQVENFSAENIKVPHMGWNGVGLIKQNPLFTGIRDWEFFYFAHSYYAPLVNETISETMYSAPFSSGVRKDNFFGVQFHPEKSGKAGLRILKNFVDLC